MSELPDVQESEPEIKSYINQVGVTNVRLPFLLEACTDERFHSIVADVSLKTDLNREKKGISMSRLPLLMRRFQNLPLKQFVIKTMLEQIIEEVDGATNAYATFRFSLPINKESPKSKHVMPIYYDCKFEGQLNSQGFRFFQGVRVQYAAYCPCSAALSKHMKDSLGVEGFPHAQRAFADVVVEINVPEVVFLEQIISTYRTTH